MLKLIALYPQPNDIEKFEKDYEIHILLLHEKMGIPKDVKPYKVTTMLPTPTGQSKFYKMFSMPFNSPEELQEAMASEGMQKVAADAVRISSGGPPEIIIGDEE